MTTPLFKTSSLQTQRWSDYLGHTVFCCFLVAVVRLLLLCVTLCVCLALCFVFICFHVVSVFSLFCLFVCFLGKGNVSVSGEFNFYADAAAAYVTLNQLGCPITVMPWETCMEHAIPLVYSVCTFSPFYRLPHSCREVQLVLLGEGTRS